MSLFWMAVDDPGEDVGQIRERVDVVEFAQLRLAKAKRWWLNVRCRRPTLQ
jgi:hypothetical protein